MKRVIYSSHHNSGPMKSIFFPKFHFFLFKCIGIFFNLLHYFYHESVQVVFAGISTFPMDKMVTEFASPKPETHFFEWSHWSSTCVQQLFASVTHMTKLSFFKKKLWTKKQVDNPRPQELKLAPLPNPKPMYGCILGFVHLQEEHSWIWPKAICKL